MDQEESKAGLDRAEPGGDVSEKMEQEESKEESDRSNKPIFFGFLGLVSIFLPWISPEGPDMFLGDTTVQGQDYGQYSGVDFFGIFTIAVVAAVIIAEIGIRKDKIEEYYANWVLAISGGILAIMPVYAFMSTEGEGPPYTRIHLPDGSTAPVGALDFGFGFYTTIAIGLILGVLGVEHVRSS